MCLKHDNLETRWVIDVVEPRFETKEPAFTGTSFVETPFAVTPFAGTPLVGTLFAAAAFAFASAIIVVVVFYFFIVDEDVVVIVFLVVVFGMGRRDVCFASRFGRVTRDCLVYARLGL